MRTGLIPENVYERSVYRIIHKYNKDLENRNRSYEVKGAADKTDCTFFNNIQAIPESISFELFSYEREDLWQGCIDLYVNELMLRLACFKAKWPSDVDISIVLPESLDEPKLRILISNIVSSVSRYDIKIKVSDVRTSRCVSSVQISIMAVAIIALVDEKIEDSRDIVMLGRVADGAGVFLARQYESRFNGRYSEEYIHRMQKLPIHSANMKIIFEEAQRAKCSVALGESGVYAALWKLGKFLKSGLVCDLQAIPVYQETIEVCDRLDINPYTTYSGGCIILLVNDGEAFVQRMNDKGIEAVHIGHLTQDNNRIIMVHEEQRFLTAPELDGIYKEVQDGNP